MGDDDPITGSPLASKTPVISAASKQLTLVQFQTRDNELKTKSGTAG